MQYLEDIVEVIRLYIDDIPDQLEMLEDLRSNIIDQKDDQQYIQNEIESICRDHNLCPKCFSNLEVHRWKEKRPYQESYANEEMSKLYCPNCSWEED